MGGSGEVWRAHDPVFGPDVALKRLRPEHGADPRHLMRFLREARLTAQLEHPGVVPVYAHGGVGAGAYYTMRLLRGRPLREHIAAFHQSIAREGSGESFVGGGLIHLLGYFIRICETIAFAHAQGVLHRDLKGRNVMIGDFGEVTVLDWGLAKEIDRPEPSPGDAPAPGARHDVRDRRGRGDRPWEPAASRDVRVQRGGARGQALDQLVPAAARAAHGEHIKAYVQAPRARRMGVVGGLQGIRRDGTAIAIDVSLSPAHTPLGLRVVCAIRDRADWR